MRRKDITNPNAVFLRYEIREIVAVAKKIEALGVKIFWENIGDPVQKGAKPPAWIKRIVKAAADDDANYGYTPTGGLPGTREFLAGLVNRRGKTRITADDILFFNGLGDAIGKIYNSLNPGLRVMGPTPAYSTHSSFEAAHSGSTHISYALDPHSSWYPDTKDMEAKIKLHPNIGGILIINPNNPTGMVYPERLLSKIVKIAGKYKIFVISDEIYANITYGKTPYCPLSDVIGNECGVAMKGISKDIPWPGSRCGWLEFYNTGRDPAFAKYVKAVNAGKMLEVASTTLPQAIIPRVFRDKRYRFHLREQSRIYGERAEIAASILGAVKGIGVIKPEGAFYMSVVFNDGVLGGAQALEIKNRRVRSYVEEITSARIPTDRRFVYYLLGAAGICLVPLSGFESKLSGFRVTLLERDNKKFKQIFQTIAEKISEYLKT